MEKLRICTFREGANVCVNVCVRERGMAYGAVFVRRRSPVPSHARVVVTGARPREANIVCVVAGVLHVKMSSYNACLRRIDSLEPQT